MQKRQYEKEEKERILISLKKKLFKYVWIKLAAWITKMHDIFCNLIKRDSERGGQTIFLSKETKERKEKRPCDSDLFQIVLKLFSYKLKNKSIKNDKSK